MPATSTQRMRKYCRGSITRTRIYIARVVGVLLALLSLAPEIRSAQLDPASLARELESIRDAFGVPGMAVVVVQGDTVVLADGFGVSHAETGAPMTADTEFGIASATKSFTAATMMLLQQDGLLDLDDPLHRFIDGFAVDDPYISRQLTLRDALSHRSGLPRTMMIWRGSNFTLDEAVSRLRHIRPVALFRQSYSYQNMLYNAMALVIRESTGQSWETLVQARLLEPLGMGASKASSDLPAATNRATGHYLVNYAEGELQPVASTPVPEHHLSAPAGGIRSTARDLARWLRFQLNGGAIGETRLLEVRAIRETWEPHVTFRSEYYGTMAHETTYLGYGLGWFLGEHRGQRLIWHGGNGEGISTVVAFKPRQGIGVAVLANLDGTSATYAAAGAVFDAALGDTDVDWTTAFAEYDDGPEESAAGYRELADLRVPDAPPSLEPAAYVALYRHPIYGDIEIAFEDGALTLIRGVLVADLTHWHYDTFEARHRTGTTGFDTVTFILNAAGNVSEMQMFDVGGFLRHQPDH